MARDMGRRAPTPPLCFSLPVQNDEVVLYDVVPETGTVVILDLGVPMGPYPRKRWLRPKVWVKIPKDRESCTRPILARDAVQRSVESRLELPRQILPRSEYIQEGLIAFLSR